MCSAVLETEMPGLMFIYLPVLLYGADEWSMTVTARWSLDAFDQWCLRHIFRIPYTTHVSNLTVCKQTDQSWLTSTILDRRVWPHLLSRPIVQSCLGIPSLHQQSTRGLATPEQSTLPVLAVDNWGRSQDPEHRPLSAWHIARRLFRWHHVEETAILWDVQATWWCW